MTAKQRGTIEDRGPNKHLLKVYLGRTAEGKRQYSSKMFAGTISEARKELTKMVSALDTNTFVRPSKRTVKDYLTTWIESKTVHTAERQGNLSAKTKAEYTDRLVKNVFPFIGGLQLSQLSPEHIRILYGKLQTVRNQGPRMIQYTHSVLSQGLAVAVEDGLLVRNPCAAKSVHESMPTVRQTPPVVLTADEQSKVIEQEAVPMRRLLWRTLLLSGLRPQEALAVQWQDLRDGALHICRAIEQLETGKEVVKEYGKTDASHRVVHLDEDTLELMQVHKAQQAREILKAGEAYQRNGFIFATGHGTALYKSNVSRWWKAALIVAGISHRNLYSTRHSHISHLVDLGENPKAIAERVGHSDPAFTLRRYTHTLPETGKRLAGAAAGVLKRRVQ